jgi:hypothetical protein
VDAASQRHLPLHRCPPDDPDTAWFVPAQSDEIRIPLDGAMVVNRTHDGGRSFETITAGLPKSTPITWSIDTVSTSTQPVSDW